MATAASERYEIKRDGGTAQKNSGRGNKHKADAVIECFNYDVKEYGKSFGVTKAVWAKATSDAIQSGNYEPALKLVLGVDKEPRLRLWVISDESFQDYIRLIRKEAEDA